MKKQERVDIEEARRIEAEMTGEEWLACPIGGTSSFDICTGDKWKEGIVEDVAEEDAEGIVYMRNNFKAILDELEQLRLRFELDRAGIEQRDEESVELVELRAEAKRLRANALSYGEALPQAMNEIARLQKENKKLNQIIFEYETMPDED